MKRLTNFNKGKFNGTLREIVRIISTVTMTIVKRDLTLFECLEKLDLKQVFSDPYPPPSIEKKALAQNKESQSFILTYSVSSLVSCGAFLSFPVFISS